MQTHAAQAGDMLGLAWRQRIGQIVALFAAALIHKRRPEAEPDRRHRGRATAQRVDSLVELEVARAVRAGLEQIGGKLKRFDIRVAIDDTLDLVSLGIPDLAAPRPGHLIPDGRDLIVAGLRATPEGGVAVLDAG